METHEDKLLQISLDLPDQAASVPLCRKAVRTVLHELGIDRLRASDIETALGEAAGNVVRHAYTHPGNRYDVAVIIFTDRVCVRVKDQGCGFDRANVSDPKAEGIGGWGVWLIEKMADHAAFRPVPGGGALLEAQFLLPHPVTLPDEPPSA